MSTGAIRIYNFDRYGDRYLFEHPAGPLKAVIGNDWDASPLDWDKGVPDVGKIKKFWLGRNVLAYTFAGVPYMKVGRTLERIEQSNAVTQFWFGPFCFYKIKCGTIRTFALGAQWFDFISRFIDPTYDEIDRMAADFAGYVKSIFERTSTGTAPSTRPTTQP